jgi:RHS repeat-associated protein
VEHNVLGPGSIGHILRNSTFSTTTHARTDHWYHYDQVGSVVCESSSSSIPSMYQRYADAWGNRMSNYTTGEWTSTWASRDGWGHNTKEYDGDAGLVYMYQRWYQPELGVFLSQAPYPPMLSTNILSHYKAQGSIMIQGEKTHIKSAIEMGIAIQ